MPGSTTVRRSAASVSWLALLAATTLGAGRFDQIRARVSGTAEVGRNYRLVVQSYARDALDSAGLPSRYARPIASAQRAVTTEELETGVSVSVLQVADELEKNPVVIAWIEDGEADLEFDARAARPQPGAAYAFSDADDDANVDLVLGRRHA
jgi:hypothetical protein